MKKKPQEAIDTIYYNDMDDSVFLSAVKRRREESETLYERMKLKSIREENNRMYLSKYLEDKLIDERYQDIFNDSRQFTSVRTIVPFLTARVTAPEVVPADDSDLAIQFAHDFEDALLKHVEKQHGKAKIRLAVQDLLRGERVGVLKWRYDRYLDDIIVEHVKADSVLIGKRARLLEEPDYVEFKLKKSVADLLNMFPEKADYIKSVFKVVKGTPSQLERIYDINESWIWMDKEGSRDLVVGWSWQNCVFGKVKDPNWSESGKNVNDHPMIPAVFFNFLNNGDSYIDETSFMEQSKWLQVNYNRMGQTIVENARYGGTGVPIFAKGSIPQKDVAKIRFSPIQRIMLDSPDVSKSFTVWQSTPLPSFIPEAKYDDRNSIDNIWGTPNIFRGEQSDNNTLGQDVLVRDQAEGRLADPVDCIDDAMDRFYKLEAQLMYRYWDQDKYVKYIGPDGKFVAIVLNQEKIAKNIGIDISVKAGTSLPIDRAQKRSTIMELLKLNKVSTLVAYKELALFDDPEAAYKQYILEIADPASSLAEVETNKINREAAEDIQIVIGGEVPEEREDINEEYVQYLTDWLNTDKYMLLQTEDQEAAARLSVFIDTVIEKAARKVNKLAMQQAPVEEAAPPQVDPATGEPIAAPPPPVPVAPIA